MNTGLIEQPQSLASLENLKFSNVPRLRCRTFTLLATALERPSPVRARKSWRHAAQETVGRFPRIPVNHALLMAVTSATEKFYRINETKPLTILQFLTGCKLYISLSMN
jgi:hypothetical protein